MRRYSVLVNSNSKWRGIRNKMQQGRCALRMSYTCYGGENGTLLDCYAACSCDSLPTFGTNCRSHQGSCLPFIGTTYPWWDPTVCPETSVRNYHYTLHNSPKSADPYQLYRMLDGPQCPSARKPFSPTVVRTPNLPFSISTNISRPPLIR